MHQPNKRHFAGAPTASDTGNNRSRGKGERVANTSQLRMVLTNRRFTVQAKTHMAPTHQQVTICGTFSLNAHCFSILEHLQIQG